MPAIIRGIFGGGGKIKDATATPQDVMTGKVFYNNEGRQVGIKSGFPIKTRIIDYKEGTMLSKRATEYNNGVIFDMYNIPNGLIFQQNNMSYAYQIHLYQELNIPIRGCTLEIYAQHPNTQPDPIIKNIIFWPQVYTQTIIVEYSQNRSEGIILHINNGFLKGISFRKRWSFTGDAKIEIDHKITITHIGA